MSSLARRSGAIIVVTVIAFALAACSGTARSAAPGATAAPTAAADRTPGPTGAPELAAKLPDAAGGQDFVKSSFTGADVGGLGLSLDEDVLQALAVNNAVQLDEIQVAEARPRDGSTGGLIVAIRVPGADPQTIVDATFGNSNALQLRTMGGKSVYDIAGSGLNVVVYLKDDVMYQVLGAPGDLTEAIVAALP
jgi:hypothetical protein